MSRNQKIRRAFGWAALAIGAGAVPWFDALPLWSMVPLGLLAGFGLGEVLP